MTLTFAPTVVEKNCGAALKTEALLLTCICHEDHGQDGYPVTKS
jgi:hypothetical protein